MPNNLSCSALKVFPLWFIFIQKGKMFSVFAAHPKSTSSWAALWHLPCRALDRGWACVSSRWPMISKIQRYIVWTSSPTLWLISSFLLQFSVSQACMRKANEINISNFWRIPFWTSNFQNRAVSEVVLPSKKWQFRHWFQQKNDFTLPCKSNQLHLTYFYCIS